MTSPARAFQSCAIREFNETSRADRMKMTGVSG